MTVAVALWEIVVVVNGLKLRFAPPESEIAVYVPALDRAITPINRRIAVALAMPSSLVFCLRIRNEISLQFRLL